MFGVKPRLSRPFRANVYFEASFTQGGAALALGYRVEPLRGKEWPVALLALKTSNQCHSFPFDK
jgi:hypothetical protein